MAIPITFRAPVLLALALAAPAAAQSTWHVRDGAPPPGNGMSWATAFDDLQLALNAAAFGDQVWVATGRYYPSKRLDPLDPRSATFEIPVNVKVYGGFNGTELTLAQRAGLFEQTLLSGDIGVPNDRSDNAYHVVYHRQNPIGNFPSRVDGFLISDGNADGAAAQSQQGAAVYVTLTGQGFTAILDLAWCTLRDNVGGKGAGLGVEGFGLVNMTGCRITGNVATDQGGAVWVRTGTLRAHNCVIDRNAAVKGGAVFLNSIGNDHPAFGPYVRFVNTLFYDNRAERGGAAFLAGGAFTSGIGSWFNCTLAYNVATMSGGAFFANTGAAIPAQLTVRNSILWNNSAPTDAQIAGSATVTYSDVRGGYPGVGNFNKDPRFANPTARDLHTLAGSPAHDAGDNAAVPPDIVDLDGDGNTTEPVPIDLDGGPRFADDPAAADTGSGTPPIVDVGAYEL